MVNINAINSINDAKEAKYYNEQNLTLGEKSIFDSQLLIDNETEEINLVEIRNTAVLLDDVKKAEKAESGDVLSSNVDLFKSLEEAKSKVTVAYKVVNGYNKIVDEAFNILLSLSKDEVTQGISTKSKVKAKGFTMDKLEISATEGSNKTQGIKGGDDVELLGDFKLTNAKITVTSEPVVKSQKEIELEIARKGKSLERKNKMLDSYMEKGNNEAIDRVEKEIEKLEEEIDNLKLEQQQTQIQVNE